MTEGKGEAKAGTGAFSLPVTFPARIGEPGGKTSPEELMAAAHAACYAMALNGTLGRKQASADRTVVRATITADKGDAGIKIVSSKLEVTALRSEGARRRRIRRGREGSRRPLPGVERVSRHDADHGRGEDRLSGWRTERSRRSTHQSAPGTWCLVPSKTRRWTACFATFGTRPAT